MNKLLFLVLLFGMVFGSGIEKTWENQYWINQNPHIISLFDFELWDSSQMHKTLETLELEKIENLEENLKQAKTYYELSKNSKKQCSVIGSLAFSTMMYNKNHISISKLIGKEITENIIFECLNYGEYWKKTMEFATIQLEEKEEEIRIICELNEEVYSKAEYSGFCSYGGCENIKQISNNCQNDFDFGELSKINYFLEYLTYFEDQLNHPVPEFNNYSVIMNRFSNEDLNNIQNEIESVSYEIENMEKEMEILDIELNKIIKETDVQLSYLEKQEIGKITCGTIVSDFISEETSSVIEKFYTINEKIKSYKLELDILNKNFELKTKNYLKNNYEQKNNILDGFLEVYNTIENLKYEIELLIKEKQNEAKLLFDSFEEKYENPNSESKELIKKAKEYFENGKKSEKLGEKFYFFRESIKYSNLGFDSEEKLTGETELEILSFLDELKELIKNAEKDNIEVSYEKRMSSYLEENINLKNIETVDQLKESILEKSKIKYSFLEGEKKEIEKSIYISPDEFGYISKKLNNYEEYFIGGKLDYVNVIGELKNIKELFDDLLDEINYKISNVFPNSLISSGISRFSNCSLKKGCEVYFEIKIINKYKIKLENTRILTYLPFEMDVSLEDVYFGLENVKEFLRDGKKIEIYLNKIEQNQTIYIQLKNQYKISELSNFEYYSKGNSEEDALLEYEFNIKNLEKIPKLKLDYVSGKIKEIRLNGMIVDFEENTVNEELKKGSNKIFVKSYYVDAFGTQKTNFICSRVGLKEKITYDLIVEPKIDLSKINFILTEGYNSQVSNLNVFSYSGHQIKNKKTSSSGKYSFEIYDVKKDETATLRVEYLIDNTMEYLCEEIEKLEYLNLSEEQEEILEEIKEELDNNKSSGLVEKLEELEQEIEKDLNEFEKTEKKMNEIILFINKEINKINLVLDSDLIYEDEFIEKLKIRKKELENYLDFYSEISKEDLLILEEIDQSWLEKESNEFKKRMYEKFNELKQEGIKLNEYKLLESEFSELESDLIEFEVSGNLLLVNLILEDINELEKMICTQKNVENNSTRIQELIKGIKEKEEKYQEYYYGCVGTELEGLFEYAPLEINNALDSENIEKMEKINLGMELILNYFKNEAKRRIIEIELIVSDDETGREILNELKQLNKEENYVEVLKRSATFAQEYQQPNEMQENGELVLLVVTIVLIVVMVGYLIKDKIDFKKYIKKQEKPMKKLQKIEE